MEGSAAPLLQDPETLPVSPSMLDDPGFLGAVVLLLLLLLAGAWYVLGGSKSGNTVILAGPSGSGKTSLFHRLRDGSTHNDFVTSMEVNDDTFALSSEKGQAAKPIQVVDVPGNPRLRHKLEKHASVGAQGVVFLVDSADFMPHIRSTAEYLFEVLSNPGIAKARTPVLLGCNKSDLGAKAHTMDFIRKKLEKEVELLRGTRGALQGGGNTLDVPLANPSEPFTFANCRNKISIATVSALKDDVGPVETFVRSCVPAK